MYGNLFQIANFHEAPWYRCEQYFHQNSIERFELYFFMFGSNIKSFVLVKNKEVACSSFVLTPKYALPFFFFLIAETFKVSEMELVAVSVVSHGLKILSFLCGAYCPEPKKLMDTCLQYVNTRI